MPLYEYVCEACGEACELLVASHKVKSVCPRCGSKKLVRQFSTFAAHQGASASACPSASECPGARGGGCGGGGCPLSG